MVRGKLEDALRSSGTIARSGREEIILHLESANQLIESWHPSPFLKGRLRQEAEKFVIEQAMNFPRNSEAKLILYLPSSEAAAPHNVPDAFRQHFTFRRDEAEKELSRLRRFGWGSLLVAFIFLGVMVLLVEIIRRYTPAGGLSSLLQAGLTILGWVAFWRPAELLLYEWYPFKRDAKLSGRLERAEVQVIAEENKGVLS